MDKVLFSSATDMWETPKDFFDELNREFDFNLDPCAVKSNAKCSKYFTPEVNGLNQSWGGVQGILQPAIRPADLRLGTEVLQRKQEARHFGGNAYTGADRYQVLPRFYLPQGERNKIYTRAAKVWRIKERRAVSVHDSNFLTA